MIEWQKDLELVKQARSGLRAERDELHDRLVCIGPFLKTIRSQIGFELDPQAAADLEQDVFLVVWERLARFEGTCRIETWVYRICFLQCMNAMRARSRSRSLSLEGIQEGASSDSMVGLQAELELEALRASMGELGGQRALILSLKHEAGLTFQEIGERVGLSTSGVKYLYYSTLDDLRTRIEQANRP